MFYANLSKSYLHWQSDNSKNVNRLQHSLTVLALAPCDKKEESFY